MSSNQNKWRTSRYSKSQVGTKPRNLFQIKERISKETQTVRSIKQSFHSHVAALKLHLGCFALCSNLHSRNMDQIKTVQKTMTRMTKNLKARLLRKNKVSLNKEDLNRNVMTVIK